MKGAAKRAGFGVLMAMALALLAIAVVMQVPDPHWEVAGRYLMHRVDTNSPYDPYFMRVQMQSLSNALSDPGFAAELTRAAQVGDAQVRFTGIHTVRSTSIIEIRFGGPDSNAVERVASNACVLLERNHFPNQLELQAQFIDLRGPFEPKTRSERLWEDFESFLRSFR